MTRIIFVFLALVQVLIVEGQEDSARYLGRRIPHIEEHEFIPISTIIYPDVNTYFYTKMGYGETEDFKLPVFQIGDWNGLALQGKIAYVDLGFKYQQNVRDWLAMYINYNVIARVGTEIQSILGFGFNTISSFDMGWKIALINKKRSRLSVNFELKKHTGNFINVVGFTKDILNDHPNPQIKEKIPILMGGLGFQYSYGLNDLIGISAYSMGAYGETYTRGVNGFRYETGACLDLNFYHKYNFPVGIAAGFGISSQPDIVYVDNKVAQLYILKIAYTKASDFNLGIEISGLNAPIPGVDSSPLLRSVYLTSRYYF